MSAAICNIYKVDIFRMGLSQSTKSFELPSDKYTATLYYFSGRGLADQIRWMLAATNVDFCQKVVSNRERFLELAACQLPFGQLPLLQIDGMEIVQSQAAVRYLARRAHIQGNSAQDALKCDMIAEAVRDVLSVLLAAPFRKYSGVGTAEAASSSGQVSSPIINVDEWETHLKMTKEKWAFTGARLEAIIQNNMSVLQSANGKNSASAKAGNGSAPAGAERAVHIVGNTLTYADILVAHVTTWMVEECGSGVVAGMPLLVSLQNQVISLPGIKKFIKSVNYFPLGDKTFVDQVNSTLGRIS